MIEKLNMQLDSTLMFFPSYTHVFAASCSHKDSTAKIQEARATALAERESAKFQPLEKPKVHKLGFCFEQNNLYYKSGLSKKNNNIL